MKKNYKEAEEMATEAARLINRLVKILKKYNLTAEQINEIITAITEQ